MAKLHLNYNLQAIEISEAFAKKASVYGSAAYDELHKVQEAHPTYRVCVQKNKSKKSSIVKGITVDVMRKYVEKHNEDNFLEEFDSLVEEKTSYFEIKAKVMNHYPQCKSYKTKADWILAA